IAGNAPSSWHGGQGEPWKGANQPLQQTAAAISVSRSFKALGAAAAAELFRSAVEAGMADDRSFIEAIGASPEDDGLRLIYADWLEEHDEPDRAEFIRVQCDLEPVRRQYENDRVSSLRSREGDLLLKHREGWLAELVALMGRWSGFDCGNVTFRRGFVDAI